MNSDLTIGRARLKSQPEQSEVAPERTVDNNQTRPKKKEETQRKGKITSKTKNTSYHWSKLQNQRYVQFLAINRKLFDLPLGEKRKIKIQPLMSQFIRTRSTQQCRSHHQKMLVKFGSVENIVNCMSHMSSPIPSMALGQNQAIQEINSGESQRVKMEAESASLHDEEKWSSEQQRCSIKQEIFNQESYVFYRTFS